MSWLDSLLIDLITPLFGLLFLPKNLTVWILLGISSAVTILWTHLRLKTIIYFSKYLSIEMCSFFVKKGHSALHLLLISESIYCKKKNKLRSPIRWELFKLTYFVWDPLGVVYRVAMWTLWWIGSWNSCSHRRRSHCDTTFSLHPSDVRAVNVYGRLIRFGWPRKSLQYLRAMKRDLDHSHRRNARSGKRSVVAVV